MQAKIRAAQQMKVPYMLVVGEREAAAGTVSLRKRDGSRQNGLSLAAFAVLVQEKIASRDGDL
jgi:threonyl-tRNA synthetase